MSKLAKSLVSSSLTMPPKKYAFSRIYSRCRSVEEDKSFGGVERSQASSIRAASAWVASNAPQQSQTRKHLEEQKENTRAVQQAWPSHGSGVPFSAGVVHFIESELRMWTSLSAKTCRP